MGIIMRGTRRFRVVSIKGEHPNPKPLTPNPIVDLNPTAAQTRSEPNSIVGPSPTKPGDPEIFLRSTGREPPLSWALVLGVFRGVFSGCLGGARGLGFKV